MMGVGIVISRTCQRAARRLPASVWSLNLALIDQAFISGVNFGTGVLTARYLGITEFGRYVLAFTVIFGANIFQQAMVLDPMLSIGSKKPNAVATPYFSALILHQTAISLGMALLVYAGTALAAALFPSRNFGGIGIPLVLAIAGYQWQEFLRRYFFARRRVGTAFVNDLLRYGTQIVAIAVVLRWDAGSTSAGSVLLIIAGSAAFALLHAAWCFGPVEWRREVIRSSIAEHWRFSRWLIPYAGLQAVNGTIFISAAGYFHGAATAGVLRASQNLVGILHVLFLGLENIVQVRAARAFDADGLAGLRRVAGRLAAFGGLATILCLALLSLNARFLLQLFYGRQYLGIEYLVYIWACGYVLNFFTMPMRISLRAMEMTKPLFTAEGLQFLFALAATYPLTKYLGAVGVLIGYICCWTMVLAFFGSILWPRLVRAGDPGATPRATPAAEAPESAAKREMMVDPEIA